MIMVLYPGGHYQLTGQLLLVLLAYANLASGTVYFITSSQNISCPQQPCLTLSQLADNSTRNSTNITLLFLPGNHNLNGKLSFTNLDSFSMLKCNVQTVTVTCTNQSGSFEISQTTTVSVKGLHIIGCGGIVIELVNHFALENTTFQGTGNFGTALGMYQTSEACIVSCFFINGKGSFYSFQPQTTFGGAIVSFHSSIWVEDTIFKRNSADFGAAIYAKESNISTNNSKFLYNTAFYEGGVLDVNSCSIHIAVCIFSGNRAGDTGGVIMTSGSSFHITDSSFSKNVAAGQLPGLFGGGGGVIHSSRDSFHIANSTFSDNTAAFDAIGGVSCSIESSFHIADSSFSHNKAYVGGVFYSSECSFNITDSLFTANHGEVIFSNTSSYNISNCSFNNNSPDYDGGVIYLVQMTGLIGNLTEGSFQIANSIFSKNSDGIFFAYNSSFTTIINCTFIDTTKANWTLRLLRSVLYITGNTTFVNNTGGSFVVASNVTFSGYTRFENCGIMHLSGGVISSTRSNVYFSGVTHMFSNQGDVGGAIVSTGSVVSISGNTIIANNKANRGGGIYLQDSNFEVKGVHASCFIFNNTASVQGGGIYAFGSAIIVYQRSALHFMDNSAKKGGGAYLEVNSKILVKKQYPDHSSPMKFAGNKAIYGGAIHVDDISNYGACTRATECFIQVQALYKIIDNNMVNWDTNYVITKSIYFTDNKASKSGDNIYGGLLNRCITDIYSETYFKMIGIESLTKYTSNATNDSISSLPVQVCFCNDHGQPDCNHQPPAIHVKKGESFTLSLAVLDQADHAVEANITSILSPRDGGFSEGQQTQEVKQGCTPLKFNMFSPVNFESLTPLAVDSPCRDSRPLMKHVLINFLNCTCPVGFEPSSDNVRCECVCDSKMSPYITHCDSTTSSLLRVGTNSWISYVNGSDPYRYVIYPHCPYDYCHPADDNISINLTIPNGADAQCAYNHTGVLCGGCHQNLSLSLGSSRCLPCTSLWPIKLTAILLAATIAGFLLVATLLVLNLTVATGLLNAFIFYANIVAASSSVFFSSSKPSLPTVFVAWLNLDIGFDTCFIHGLDAYTKTWLQTAFPAYIIALVVLVIIISEHSPRFTRLIGRRDPVATLATLILLSYAKLLSTTISVLSFAILDYPDGSHVVWLPDGNVKYLQGKHIILFTAAILIVLLGVSYTLLLFFWQWCIQTPHWVIFGWIRNTRLNGFITTYHAPYSIKHRYWTGLLLLVRVVLYITAAVTVSSDPQFPLLMTNILVGGLIFLKGIMGMRVYKGWLVDTVETLIYLNLLVFAALSLYHFNSDAIKQTAISYTSTTITFILLAGVVLIHGIVLVKKFFKPAEEIDECVIAPLQLAPEHAKTTYSYVKIPTSPSTLEPNEPH